MSVALSGFQLNCQEWVLMGAEVHGHSTLPASNLPVAAARLGILDELVTLASIWLPTESGTHLQPEKNIKH